MELKRRNYKPEVVQDYILATVIRGEPKLSSFQEYVSDEYSDPKSAYQRMERSDQYINILQKVMQDYDVETNKALAKARQTHFKKYASLLEHGDKTIETAETTKDKVQAMDAQRSNLAIPMITQMIVGGNSSQSDTKFDNTGLIE